MRWACDVSLGDEARLHPARRRAKRLGTRVDRGMAKMHRRVGRELRRHADARRRARARRRRWWKDRAVRRDERPVVREASAVVRVDVARRVVALRVGRVLGPDHPRHARRARSARATCARASLRRRCLHHVRVREARRTRSRAIPVESERERWWCLKRRARVAEAWRRGRHDVAIDGRRAAVGRARTSVVRRSRRESPRVRARIVRRRANERDATCRQRRDGEEGDHSERTRASEHSSSSSHLASANASGEIDALEAR